MPTANIDNVSLYYEETGQGEPVLLLPPSWWPAATWNVGVVPALSQRYHTIIFDCRGTGHSSNPRKATRSNNLLKTPLRFCRISKFPVAMSWASRWAGKSCRQWPSRVRI